MKIVHICQIYLDSYRYQDQLLPKSQHELGHEVTIITPLEISANYYKMTEADYDKKSPYMVDGVKVIRCAQNFMILGNRFARIKKLYDLINKEKPDLLYCHGIQNFDVLTAYKYKMENPKCCVVADVHSDFHNSGRNIISRKVLHKVLWKYIAQKVEKQFDRIYYITPCVREFIKQLYGLPDDKLHPTYLGANLKDIQSITTKNVREEIRKEFNVLDEDTLIVTAGKIDNQKMTHILLDAVNRLENNKLHVLIVGKIVDEYREIHEYQKENSQIHTVGWVDGVEVLKYFHASDLAVFPNRQSALWQEAICTGLPCVFGYYPGLEYLNPGGNAKFLYSRDGRELAQLIELIVNNRSVINKMRRGAIEIARQKFDYLNIANDIIEFAENIQQ